MFGYDCLPTSREFCFDVNTDGASMFVSPWLQVPHELSQYTQTGFGISIRFCASICLTMANDSPRNDVNSDGSESTTMEPEQTEFNT